MTKTALPMSYSLFVIINTIGPSGHQQNGKSRQGEKVFTNVVGQTFASVNILFANMFVGLQLVSLR